MRFSHEHTPPFTVEREPQHDWAGEVYDMHPAVELWMRDEAGEDWFLDVMRAAIRYDLVELVEARERLVERWKGARQGWMPEYRRRMERKATNL